MLSNDGVKHLNFRSKICIFKMVTLQSQVCCKVLEISASLTFVRPFQDPKDYMILQNILKLNILAKFCKKYVSFYSNVLSISILFSWFSCPSLSPSVRWAFRLFIHERPRERQRPRRREKQAPRKEPHAGLDWGLRDRALSPRRTPKPRAPGRPSFGPFRGPGPLCRL